MAESQKDEKDDVRVSLAPLSPREALKGLLAVRPDDEHETPAPTLPDADAPTQD